MNETAYFTADQLAARDPGTPRCTPHPAPRGYTVNDDGSNPFTCGDLGRPVGNRISSTTGLCSYHERLAELDIRPTYELTVARIALARWPAGWRGPLTKAELTQ